MNKSDKRKKHRINIIISIAIITGFILTIIINTLAYNSLIKEGIKNISKLSSTNIYSEINNELIKPIFVSLTMANDSFLKEWLEHEGSGESGSRGLVEYLEGLKVKYNYNSVFMVSAKTNDYYHYKGLYKKVSIDDEHDKWYFDFINSKNTYELDVDQDEVDNNNLTVFVNCRIENEVGELLGVVGVGLEMNKVQNILSIFEDAYDLEAFLVDSNGLVQVSTNYQMIEVYNIKEDSAIKNFIDDIFANKKNLKTYRYNENGIDGYLITRYIEDLEWTLMVKKDTSVLRNAFYSQIGKVLIIIILVILAVVLISNNVINGFQKRMNEMAKTDELTGLLNRRGFNQVLYDCLHVGENKEEEFTVFIFDIDNFKKVNDQYGHLFGDKVISLLANQARKSLENQGVTARWGGDEFAGVIYNDIKSSKQLLLELQKSIANNKQFDGYEITISVGITTSRFTDTPDIVMGRVDDGLYKSKESGKNQITIVK